ncbi:hypothetical protein ACS0TY_018777 [Phlomoides rotata]
MSRFLFSAAAFFFTCLLIQFSLRKVIFVYSVSKIFPTVSLNFTGGATMVLRPEDYLLQQNSVDPSIFYRCINPTKTYERPGSGSVILMSIELLTKISVKPSFFQIDVCHIAQSQRVPGALFQYFLRLQISEDPIHSSVFSI